MVTLVVWPRRRRRRLVAIKELSNAHSLPDDVNCAHFGIHSKGGLGPAEIEKRQRDFRPNQYNEPTRASALVSLARQVSDALTLVLIAALVLSFAVKDWVEAAVVCAVEIIIVGLAFVQELKAERIMASFRKIASPTAQVYRGGQKSSITSKATEFVPGDVELSTGDIFPADIRLISLNGLGIEKSALAGESVPVSRQQARLDLRLPDLGRLQRRW
ncbi:hypothetical protein A4X09_0g7024 [Tilletia walkeri]|uniref:Cation-transporting P-type ATPase N-terminal domain-containing protein n=1 Tax=Tilletia walkeri TaxID=117179 RepID=A0A8X7N2N7_9BASI|nr:hypothetical protein A4X09_0g7024 [Tilletia walkeri]